MNDGIPKGFAHYVRGLIDSLPDDPQDDADLIAAFLHERDQRAFTSLVARHGPAVWAACRRSTWDRADAEDAFQATFITLACRAGSVRGDSLAGWLQTVVRRVASRIGRTARRREAAHRRLCERVAPLHEEITSPEVELRAAVREELAVLPLRLRAPLSLYYLEGKTQPDVGRILGMPQQTVSHRLRKGLDALRERLAKRGMVVSGVALVALLGDGPAVAALPDGLLEAATSASLSAATGGPAVTAAAQLAEELARSARRTRFGWLALATVAVGLAVAGTTLGMRTSGPAADPTRRPAIGSMAFDSLQPDATVRFDRFGDPLPAGAIARIGTARFCPPGGVADLACLLDGRVVTVNDAGKLAVLRAGDGAVVAELAGPPGANVVAAAADGRRIVVAGPGEIWGCDLGPGGFSVAWRRADPPVKRRQTVATAFSSDGRNLLFADDGGLRIVDADTGDDLGTLDGTAVVLPRSLVVATGSPFAAALLRRGQPGRTEEIAVWDLRSKTRFAIPIPADDVVHDFALAPGGDRVAWVAHHAEATVVRVAAVSGKRTEVTWTSAEFPLLAFSRDGSEVAEFGPGGRTVYREPETGAVTRTAFLGTAEGWDEPAAGCRENGRLPVKRLSAKGRLLAVGGEFGVQVYEIGSGREIGPSGRLYGAVRGLAFSPNGDKLVAVAEGSKPEAARVWDVGTGLAEHRIGRSESRSLDGTTAVPMWPWFRGGADWTLRWTGGGAEWTSAGTSSRELARAPGGRSVVRVANANSLAVHDGPGAEIGRLALEGSETPLGLSLSRDGRRAIAAIATGPTPADCGLVVWDVASGGRVAMLRPAETRCAVTARPILSDGGRRAAMGTFDGQHGRVIAWNPASENEPVRLRLVDCQPTCLALARCGRRIAVGTDKGKVEVWDLDFAGGRLLTRFVAHSGTVTALAFSPDGRRLASGGIDAIAMVWETGD